MESPQLPNNLYEFFYSYIKKSRPELFDLDKDDLRRQNGSFYGYELSNFETHRLYFMYFIEPYNIELMNTIREFPKVRVTERLKNELWGIFGIHYKNLLKKWFLEQYNLPVKSFED